MGEPGQFVRTGTLERPRFRGASGLTRVNFECSDDPGAARAQPPLKSRWHLHNYSHGQGRKEGGLKHFRGHLPGTRTSVALPAGGREQTLVVGKSVSPSYFVSVLLLLPRPATLSAIWQLYLATYFS